MPYRSIDDPAKLRRLLEAVFLLEADLALPALLRHLVEEACAMTGARYGALGVLSADRTELADFIAVGLDPETEQAIGPHPTGRGVLGLLITDPEALRVSDVRAHPESAGFPEHHPHMTSFLGVPVTVRNEVYGNLYLAEKIGWSEFTADDEALVKALALAAGIAVENARLHERVQNAAVIEDRDRIARDLHDAVIQRVFAVGLTLQSLVRAVDTTIAERLSHAVDDLDETIRQIRSSIFDLSVGRTGHGPRRRILDLATELEPVLGFEPHVVFDGPVDTSVPDHIVEHLLLALREALTNVGRHAHATEVAISLGVESGRCTLRVDDNGRGLDPPSGGEANPSDGTDGGLGLVNLRRRAEKLGGTLSVESSEKGFSLAWQVPLGDG